MEDRQENIRPQQRMIEGQAGIARGGNKLEGKALVGWKAIAQFLGWTLSKTVSKRREMREAGIILDALKGKPHTGEGLSLPFLTW